MSRASRLFLPCLALFAALGRADEPAMEEVRAADTTNWSPKACRPLFSTSAGLAEPGVLELELGVQRLSNRDGSEDRNLPTQFNLGVCRWFDVRFGWSGPMLRKDSQGQLQEGDGDPVFGAQFLGLEQSAAGLDLGLAYWHKLPRASVERGIGTGRHDDTLLLTASRTFGRWALDLNAGANWIGRPAGEGRVRQGAASLSVTYAVAEGWNLTLDTYALEATELNKRAVSSILAVSREINPSLCVDLGIESGHTQGAPRMSLNAGLVWRIGRIWNQ
jgi:hypothetical protein